MKATFAHMRRTVASQRPAVLVCAGLLLGAGAVAVVPAAGAAVSGLITTHDIENGAINSHKILDGHVLAQDLSPRLRAQIARGAANAESVAGKPGRPGKAGKPGKAGRDGAPGARGPAGATGPAGQNGADGGAGQDGADGQNGADGRDGADGQAGTDTTVDLTDVGDGWESHAQATRDPDGWVHLDGYVTCNGEFECAEDMLQLPPGFQPAGARAVVGVMAEQPFGGGYDDATAVFTESTVAILDAESGQYNGSDVWLSNIVYKAAPSN